MLDALLAASPPEADSLRRWWDATAAARVGSTIERALLGGALADRLGYAFASGYAEALRSLVPDLHSITALCATEEGGNHPRAIQTTLRDGLLRGHKKWATAASEASELLVVASIGEVDARRNRLRVVRVRADAPGVHLTSSAAPFIPEIPHAEVRFDDVQIAAEDVLPGDGYDDYLKPFRTVEDLHVHAALVGYLLGVSRRHALPPTARESLLALALTTQAMLARNLRSPSTHLALAGLLDLVTRVVADIEQVWTAPSDELARWHRDRALLQVAGKARIARRDTARAALATH